MLQNYLLCCEQNDKINTKIQVTIINLLPAAYYYLLEFISKWLIVYILSVLQIIVQMNLTVCSPMFINNAMQMFVSLIILNALITGETARWIRLTVADWEHLQTDVTSCSRLTGGRSACSYYCPGSCSRRSSGSHSPGSCP